MQIDYRYATADDAKAIAHLHARSWQQHYAGIWSEEYLKGPVVTDRLEVWQRRFDAPADNQQIIIAESDHTLVGFTCIFINDDDQYGTLLDNLHVSSAFHGKGIGRQLMAVAAKLANEQSQSSSLYLWVLEDNHAARSFYERLQGEKVETTSMKNPDGSYSQVCRYFWINSGVLYQYGLK
jgi:ribosomal protein S18 acetylase RimI-like enzyme